MPHRIPTRCVRAPCVRAPRVRGRRIRASGVGVGRRVVVAVVAAVAAVSIAVGTAVAVGASGPSAVGAGLDRSVAATMPGAAAGAGVTPLLSIRRVPGWMATGLAAQRLAASLGPIVAPGALGKATACLVVEQGGRTIASLHPGTPLIPASNMKLLTATAALDELGRSYRYTTRVEASPAPTAGVVHGDLYLVGGGDPVLRTPQYEASLRDAVGPYTSLPALAAQVRAAGIREVTGTVIGDESRYDTERAIPTWLPAYTEEGDAGPLSALDVDDGFAPVPGGFAAPGQPAQGAAQTFSALLTAAGVEVLGAAATVGRTPAAAVPVASIRSQPLSEVLSAILAPSDDTAAEVLAKELGRVAGGSGTTAAGMAVVGADLRAHRLPVAGLVAEDGSGLDRGDRATCGLVAAALTREQPAGVLASDLAVAGSTGTLANRLRGTPAAGRVRAKTGTLSDVSALSGYVMPSPAARVTTLQLRAPLVFSLIMDGVPVATGVEIGNRLALALARYPIVPPVSALRPLP